ncbi:MAG: beta-lactamase family protein, partial [Luteimonas sp.]|nr:beta-lactamase family protein [Luteimonas sp.]
MKANLHRPRRTRLGGAVLLGLLSAFTLSSTAQTPLAWERDASTAGHVTATPAVATYPSDRPAPLPADLKRLPLAGGFDVRVFEAMAQDLVANQRVPGLAMAIVHDGRVLSARGYGITDVAHADPVDAHTVFRLASLSKSFAGTLTGMLVSEGALRWDSRVA